MNYDSINVYFLNNLLPYDFKLNFVYILYILDFTGCTLYPVSFLSCSWAIPHSARIFSDLRLLLSPLCPTPSCLRLCPTNTSPKSFSPDRRPKEIMYQCNSVCAFFSWDNPYYLHQRGKIRLYFILYLTLRYLMLTRLANIFVMEKLQNVDEYIRHTYKIVTSVYLNLNDKNKIYSVFKTYL